MQAETICQKRPLFRDTGQWLQLPEATLYDRHTFLHGHGLCGRPSPADHPERPIRRTSALRERAVSGTSEGPQTHGRSRPVGRHRASHRYISSYVRRGASRCVDRHRVISRPVRLCRDASRPVRRNRCPGRDAPRHARIRRSVTPYLPGGLRHRAARHGRRRPRGTRRHRQRVAGRAARSRRGRAGRADRRRSGGPGLRRPHLALVPRGTAR